MGQISRSPILLVAATVMVSASCASAPRESAVLNREVGLMIASAREAHLALLETWMDERRDRLELFLEERWIPRFLADYLPRSAVLDSLRAAEDEAARGRILQLFGEAAVAEVARVRDVKLRALDRMERLVRRRVEDHYVRMLRANEAVTRHLSSVAGTVELRDRAARRLGLPDPHDLVPLEPIDRAVAELVETGGSAGEVVEASRRLVEQVRVLLREVGAGGAPAAATGGGP